MKKYFAFGDVHGEFRDFYMALIERGFNIENRNHILICLGDSFDRGHLNKEMYEFLFKYRDRIYFIMGNHDQMLVDFLSGRDNGEFNCQYNGLFETIRDLSHLAPQEAKGVTLESMKHMILNNYPDILNFLQKMPDGYKLDNYIFTHGGLKKNLINDKWYTDNWAKTPTFIRQMRDCKKYEHYTFVFGHWHVFRLNGDFLQKKEEHRMFVYRNFIGLDGCTNYSHRVNILVVETNTIPQPFGGSIDLDMLE